jgi:hypothetical protein
MICLISERCHDIDRRDNDYYKEHNNDDRGAYDSFFYKPEQSAIYSPEREINDSSKQKAEQIRPEYIRKRKENKAEKKQKQNSQQLVFPYI